MPAAPGDLCLLADVKQYLNIGSGVTTNDVMLQRLITAKSAQIAQYIGRNVGTGTVTEVRNGSGTNQLFLARWPVTAVTSVTIGNYSVPVSANGSAGYTIQLWDGVTIPIKESVLMLTAGWGVYPTNTFGPYCGLFTPGQANVTVVYTAGFATVPFDIAQACIELVGQTYKQKDRLAQNTVNQATQSVNFITKMLPSVIEALAPYRRVTPYTL